MLIAHTVGTGGETDPDAIVFPSSQALLDYSTHRLLWSWYSRDRDTRNNWTEF